MGVRGGGEVAQTWRSFIIIHVTAAAAVCSWCAVVAIHFFSLFFFLFLSNECMAYCMLCTAVVEEFNTILFVLEVCNPYILLLLLLYYDTIIINKYHRTLAGEGRSCT